MRAQIVSDPVQVAPRRKQPEAGTQARPAGRLIGGNVSDSEITVECASCGLEIDEANALECNRGHDE
jgi:hypothetical protein